ncbi:hypothetical protein [Pseudomonas leptonychotis]|uniref:hypothetical protein n=1 Tax=Pseudomonas leptonychotis TaxID=2448482 RepID=UPI00386DDED0
MKLIRIFSFLLIPLLTACAASSSAPTFSQIDFAPTKEDKAIFYIFREYAEPTAWKATIYIDGNEIVSLPQQGFTWIYLKPGKHTVTSRWSSMAGVPTVEFSSEFLANSKFFYEIVGTAKATGATAGINGPIMSFSTTAQINTPEEKIAIEKLSRCCRYITPETNEI